MTIISLEYEETIREEGYIFIRYVRDGGEYRKKFLRGSGKYRRVLYSLETYERVKWGKYRHKYIHKKEVMPPIPKRTPKTSGKKTKRKRRRT